MSPGLETCRPDVPVRRFLEKRNIEKDQQAYRLPPIHQKGPLAPSQEPIPAEQQHVYDAVNAERAAMAEALRMELASTEIHMDVLRERQVRLTQRLAQLEGTGAY